MQAVSLFAALLATAAISLNMSFPIGLDCPSNGYNGVWRYYNEGNSYLVKVPPCADNVNKTKIFEFYTYYTNPENLTANICQDYADYVVHNSTGVLPLVNCTTFVEEFICNAISGAKDDCGTVTHAVVA